MTADFEPFDFSQGPLRVGVLGASRIVPKALLEPARGLFDVQAIAARELARAQAFAEENGIPRAFGSYQELVSDPQIDAVYIALPASGHAPWTIAALRAKKHVLCEKPFGLDAPEAKSAVRVAREEKRLLMEAHHWRYHPLLSDFERAVAQLRGPHHIEAVFNGGLNHPGDIRLDPLLGPGVLMDFGCYLIQWSRFAAQLLPGATGERPDVRKVEIFEEAPGVDLAAQASLVWPHVTAQLCCDMRDEVPFVAYLRVKGENGMVHLNAPLFGEGARLLGEINGKEIALVCPGPSTYRGQAEAFLLALQSGCLPPTAGDDLIETQELLDAIYLAGGSVTRKTLREETLARG